MTRVQITRALLGRLFGALSLCQPVAVQAQLPLNIEELLVETATLKIETGTAFRHAEEWLLGVSQDGGVPVLIRRDLEVSEVSTRLRYGLSSELELNGGLRINHLRWRQPLGEDGSDTGQVVDAGVNWLVSRDSHTPALLLQLGADMAGDAAPGAGERVYGGALRFAATAYRGFDPVVLSLGAGYEYKRRRSVGGRDFKPGNLAWLIPQVNFAVNERVTLIGGLGLYLRDADHWQGALRGERQTLTTLRLGSGFAFGKQSTVFVGSDLTVSGQRSARLAMDWVYRF